MISIGTDIIKTKRVKKLIHDKGDVFLNKIFTSKEVAYCTSNSKPYIHFSGKYAAKEAVKKALLSNAIVQSISLKKIEILSIKTGFFTYFLPIFFEIFHYHSEFFKCLT